MDRLLFVQSIGYKDFEKSIVRFFDENMALYNLVVDYQIVCNCITGNVDNTSINFDLKFSNENNSEIMYSIIDGKSICLYGHKYYINAILDSNIINIKLIDKNIGCNECK